MMCALMIYGHDAKTDQQQSPRNIVLRPYPSGFVRADETADRVINRKPSVLWGGGNHKNNAFIGNHDTFEL